MASFGSGSESSKIRRYQSMQISVILLKFFFVNFEYFSNNFYITETEEAVVPKQIYIRFFG